jgi:hypothetical protein
VDATGSGSCPMTGLGIGYFENLGSATIIFVIVKLVEMGFI